MMYSREVEEMCVVAKGPNHGPAPIPVEGRWVQAKEVKVYHPDIAKDDGEMMKIVNKLKVEWGI